MNSDAKKMKNLVVIGLDCAEPSLVFNHFSSILPGFRKLAQHGFAAKLRSTDPPLTIPAWATMTTGCDPGDLGCYGLRNRTSTRYDSLEISSSLAVKPLRIWDTLAQHGYRSVVVGVPQTYPVKPMNGCLVSGMLTPNTRSQFTWPDTLQQELLNRFPDYRVDISDFRTQPPADLKNQIFDMTRTRFETFRYLLDTQHWEFAMMVEIGLDRLHHGFWHYWDETHPLYKGENEFSSVLPDYYRLLDSEIQKILECLPDDTAVLIVSDHGAQPMRGGFRINEWLRQNGYLTLKQEPATESPLTPDMIDWSRTKAWGEGGYFGRIFLNIASREPKGIIPLTDARQVRETLSRQLTAILEPVETACGVAEPMGNRVIFPDRHFPIANGLPPDLMVYFGNLAWRSLGGVGPNEITFGNGLFTRRNDRGPDGANHDFNGILISNVPPCNDSSPERRTAPFESPQQWDILDIEPFIRSYFGIPSLDI